MEPLRIEELAMENNAGAVRIKALFSEIVAVGASNYTIKDVRSDIKKLRIDLSLGIPRVEVRGKYEVIGNVLLLPVRSNGDFWAEFCKYLMQFNLIINDSDKNVQVWCHIVHWIIFFQCKQKQFDKLSEQKQHFCEFILNIELGLANKQN